MFDIRKSSRKLLLLALTIGLLQLSPLLFSSYGADILDEIMPISKDKERRIGQSISKQVEKQFEETDDPLVQKRFEDIGLRLSAVCERQDMVYHFKVLKAKDGQKDRYYNAFAIPGGYVYMFDALLELLDTDEKIAAVTAHELGHICSKHAIKRMQSSLGINALMLLAMATAQDGRTLAKANEGLAQLMLAYSREDELEADRLSVKYLKDADFDPEGVYESLKALRYLRKKGREMNYTDYRSHPYLSERLSAARSEIQGYTDFNSYINIPDRDKEF